MSDDTALRRLSEDIADAIGRRDADMLAGLLAPGFVHRGAEGATTDADAFLAAIRAIPGEIVFVRVEQLTVVVAADAAMVTGVQHAQVRLDEKTFDDRRHFADFFIRSGGGWKLRAAADFAPAAAV